MSVVVAESLTMTYRVPVRAGGLGAALASVVRRRYRDVHAVRQVEFDIAPGEVVGFIGPNGAGKTTTMKLLAGLLHPTSGSVRVLGFTPWQRKTAFLKQIALIRGSQPVGGSQELTVLDALDYQRLLYDITRDDYRRTRAELTEMLELEPLLERQLRALSLGEKMRVGLALALLYRPRVLFLDEPTLGLDVSATATIRRFLAAHAEQTGATILLTSHYMADVQSLCERLLLIDDGRIQYDGSLSDLSARLSPYKVIRVNAPEAKRAEVEAVGEIVSNGNGTWVLRVPRTEVARATATLLSTVDVADLAVEEPALEDVIDRAYRGGLA